MRHDAPKRGVGVAAAGLGEVRLTPGLEARESGRRGRGAVRPWLDVHHVNLDERVTGGVIERRRERSRGGALEIDTDDHPLWARRAHRDGHEHGWRPPPVRHPSSKGRANRG